MMNGIKREQKYPQCLEDCNVTFLWKRKGEKNDFGNQRGIFRVNIFRTILERLIYNDEYPSLEKRLTDSNVGARKFRNIRDNIFVINAIMNSVVKGNEEAVQVQVYDIEKCFDSLWVQEVINAVFEAGMVNDKLPLLFQANQNANIAVKCNGRLSRRISTLNIIMQGTVWGSLFCTILMDKLAKLIYSKSELQYFYKGVVGTPTLGMVDDILGITKCNNSSKPLNVVINTFVNLNKMKLNENKCHSIHIGKVSNGHRCPELTVDGKNMKPVNSEKYLGEIIASGTRGNDVNIEKRKSKGIGIVSEILALIDEIPLGKYKTQMGLLLREAWFMNGILYNSEVWHSVTKSQIECLEKIDQTLLRGILGGLCAKCPIEFLHLETGTTPIRYIIATRRMIYLKTILNRKPTELIRKIYETQIKNPNPGDYCELVNTDLKNIGVHMSTKQIEIMDTSDYKSMIKKDS